VLRAAVAILAALVVVLTGVAWTTKVWLNSAITQVDALDPDSPAVRGAARQAGADNVLVLTTDFPTTGRPFDPRIGSVVVAHVPAGGTDVVVLSLPPDLEINRPPCERWDPASRTYLDETVPAETRTTLLGAFEVGGPRCATRVVQQVTGLAVTRAVALDRAGMAAMATAVGVDACPQGPSPDTERARIERDHQVLAATMRETLSFSTLLVAPALFDLRAALESAVLADRVGINRLLGLARSLGDPTVDGVRSAAAPTGEALSSRGHTLLREAGVAGAAGAGPLFRALREDTPLPPLAEGRGVAGPGPRLRPDDVTVDILDASGRGGLAATVAQQLEGFDFTVGEVGDAEDPTRGSVITFSPDQTAAAELLAATLPATTLDPEPASTGVLQLVLGSGFDDVVQAPVASPTAAMAPGCG